MLCSVLLPYISHVHRIVTCGIDDQHRSPVADRIFTPCTKYDSRKGAVALHTISSMQVEIEIKPGPVYNANTVIQSIHCSHSRYITARANGQHSCKVKHKDVKFSSRHGLFSCLGLLSSSLSL